MSQNNLPSIGAEKLGAYLAKKKKSRRKFALEIDVWPERLHRFIKGASNPTLAEACKIAKAIPGMKPDDWLPRGDTDAELPKPVD